MTNFSLRHTLRCLAAVAATIAFTACCISCEKKKPAKVVNNVAAMAKQLNDSTPQKINDDITLTECTARNGKLVYTYCVNKDYLEKIDINTTRSKHAESLTKGKSMNLAKKLTKENFGIAYIYTDTVTANSIAISFTAEELKQLCAADSTAKQ